MCRRFTRVEIRTFRAFRGLEVDDLAPVNLRRGQHDRQGAALHAGAGAQRDSSRPNSASHSSHGFSAFTRASDGRDTSPTPRRYSLRDCADRFDTDVPQAATPG